MFAGALFAKLGLPDFFALEIKGNDGVDAIVRRGDIDSVSVYGRHRSSLSRKRNFPLYSIRRPLGRVACTGTASGIFRSPPVGPVFGDEAVCCERDQDRSDNRRGKGESSHDAGD